MSGFDRLGSATQLQWHRARKCADDPQFSTARILEGLASGAALEIDLVLSGDDQFVIMHDSVLDRETDGQGPVNMQPAAALKRLNRRDRAGRVLDEKVGLLADIAQRAARRGVHPRALLHLDYKLDNLALSDGALANFVAAIAPLSGQVLVTTGDILALTRLGQADPALRIGFDPMETSCMETLIRTRDFPGFVRDVVRVCPRAEMIALQYTFLEECALAGIDVVGAFRAEGRWVDAYTIRSSLPHHVALARFLIQQDVALIAADDAAGLEAQLGGEILPAAGSATQPS